MFLASLSKIGSSIKQWYKMKSFVIFNLDLFIRVIVITISFPVSYIDMNINVYLLNLFFKFTSSHSYTCCAFVHVFGSLQMIQRSGGH